MPTRPTLTESEPVALSAAVVGVWTAAAAFGLSFTHLNQEQSLLALALVSAVGLLIGALFARQKVTPNGAAAEAVVNAVVGERASVIEQINALGVTPKAKAPRRPPARK